jgi:hypothetical protein
VNSAEGKGKFIFFQSEKQQASMSSPPSPLIWFLLVDSATGQPYKGTTVSSILRSSLVVPVIDQFRDAVKAKHSNKLSSVDAADLLVYKNKAAFDKRTVLEEKVSFTQLKKSSKKTLCWMVWESQRKMPSLS